jgi:tetratricopeptide (TPR) repeat protein
MLMNSTDHSQSFHLANDHVSNGRLDDALAIFTQLQKSDLDDFGKAMACVNAAIVSEKLGKIDQALDWYDRGIRLERALGRYFVALHKTTFCMDKERHDEAMTMVRTLVDSSISDLDKANACLNAAIVCDKLGQEDKALDWYDRGIKYEFSHHRYLVAEHKAAYLARKGKTRESLRIYEQLAREASLTEADKDRIRHNITLLQK